jgi:hypothetical protein
MWLILGEVWLGAVRKRIAGRRPDSSSSRSSPDLRHHLSDQVGAPAAHLDRQEVDPPRQGGRASSPPVPLGQWGYWPGSEAGCCAPLTTSATACSIAVIFNRRSCSSTSSCRHCSTGMHISDPVTSSFPQLQPQEQPAGVQPQLHPVSLPHPQPHRQAVRSLPFAISLARFCSFAGPQHPQLHTPCS